jgi:hypothetical protein
MNFTGSMQVLVPAEVNLSARFTDRRAFRDPSLRCGRRGRRLLYTAFAETCWAFGRIDLAPQLRRLLDLLQPGAITGGADSLGQNLTRLFHYDQSLK